MPLSPIVSPVQTRKGWHAAIALACALCFHTASAAPPIDDSFDGASLDSCKWEDMSLYGTASQSGGLMLTTDGSKGSGVAKVLSQSRLVGDFDVQVDYHRGSGFAGALPGTSDGIQLNVTLGLYWDRTRFVEFSRSRNPSESLVAIAPPKILLNQAVPHANETSESGTLRIVRAGNQATFMHSTGQGWTTLGSLAVPSTPVFVYLSLANLELARALSATMDNFRVNSGATDNVSYTQPGSFSKRPDFALGGVSENWPAYKYFSDIFPASDPLTTFRQNGMEWMRVGVTTQSSPELDSLSPGQWRQLGWQTKFWGSREYAARTLRDASDRGMRLYAYLYFSDGPANWGNQPAPASWAGKSIAETAALMEQHAFDTATYFKSKGLNVEIFELGNETDIGMVDFLPGRRIPVPAGVDWIGDRTWLRDNVWSVQATLLKAAAAGIRRADSSARIAVHIAGLDPDVGPDFAADFFRAMRDFGVDYDIAALSLPYAQGDRPWTLDRYTTACWFRRVAREVDQIAVPGKPVMVAEASYQSDPVQLLSAPMRDFPFTAQGQSDWLREQLRFATNHPSIVGWFYFYPEFGAVALPTSDEAYLLTFGGLLSSPTTTRPALEQFRPNLGPPSANTVEYYHAGFDHYFLTFDVGEIGALDAGAFGGAWRRTGQTFMSHANPAVGTVPLCRFFSTSFAPKSSHFYTADANECEYVRHNPNWQFENIAFHLPLPDAGGNCPQNTVPVYRMYNSGQGGAPNHRFTTDLAIRQDFVNHRGFVPEGAGPIGVSMCAPK